MILLEEWLQDTEPASELNEEENDAQQKERR